MRHTQMMAITALMASAVAPYAVSADTTGSVTTENGGTSRSADVTTTNAIVTTTTADVTTVDTTFVENTVDYTLTSPSEGSAERFKSAMIGEVNLVIAADGKKYAQIAFIKSSYAMQNYTDKAGTSLEVISESGTPNTLEFVKVVKIALDDKYQATVIADGGERFGKHELTFDLSHEKFDFGFDTSLPDNNTYFKNWTPNADVVTLKDGKKVAYVTFAGHSYDVANIYEGTGKTKPATVVTSSGSAATKDLTRVVRLELGADNKAQALLDGGERGSYTFTFDFSEKEATPNFATVSELAKSAALKAEYAAVDAAAFWHAMAFPSAVSNPVAKAVNGKIQVSYDLTNVKSFKATQAGKEVAVTVANDKAKFTVDTLEGLSYEVAASAERNGAVTETTYKVNLTKAVVDPTITVEDEVIAPTIPTTTNVEGKKATVSFTASSASLNSYFQKGFFGGVEIVEIDGQSYADLNIVEKSIGLEYNYIMPNGTTAEVAEISGNRATQNGAYEGFSAIIRIPVTVDDKGAFTFTLDTFGGQPGTDSEANYKFTFTGKIQNNVALPYSDLKSKETKAYVQQLANWGALNLNLTKFNPGSDLTRGQFSLMIARTLELKPAKANQFKDLGKDAELQSAIQALFEAGIVKGYDNNTNFKPNNKITRTQAAIMIHRLLTHLKFTSTATVNDLNFNDAGDIKSAEAQLAFATLQKEGIMTGSNGFVNPTSQLKRSQMAKILVESLNKAKFEK